MDDVLEQAKKLAQMLAADERTKAFHEAAAAVEADPEASRTQEAYAAAVEAVQRREAGGQPIEPEHKRAFAAAAEAVRRSPALVKMLRSHQAYAELMEAVQTILAGGASGTAGECCGEHDSCSHGHGEEAGERREEEPPQKSVLWTP